MKQSVALLGSYLEIQGHSKLRCRHARNVRVELRDRFSKSIAFHTVARLIIDDVEAALDEIFPDNRFAPLLLNPARALTINKGLLAALNRSNAH